MAASRAATAVREKWVFMSGLPRQCGLSLARGAQLKLARPADGRQTTNVLGGGSPRSSRQIL